MNVRTTAFLVACTALGGCTSPEATRSRGGGPGGDPQNRPKEVRMHEGSRQYWETPREIDVQHPPLDAAGHAQQVATR